MAAVCAQAEARFFGWKRVVVQVTFCREGDAQSAALDAYLINEPMHPTSIDDTTAVEASSLGYDVWIKYLQDQTYLALQQWLTPPQ
jgi:hypothetical protein